MATKSIRSSSIPGSGEVLSTFRQISTRSRILLKKAVRSKDREALDALIIDIEYSIQLASGNLSELLHASPLQALGKYVSKAMETLSLAEFEYRKLAGSEN